MPVIGSLLPSFDSGTKRRKIRGEAGEIGEFESVMNDDA